MNGPALFLDVGFQPSDSRIVVEIEDADGQWCFQSGLDWVGHGFKGRWQGSNEKDVGINLGAQNVDGRR